MVACHDFGPSRTLHQQNVVVHIAVKGIARDHAIGRAELSWRDNSNPYRAVDNRIAVYVVRVTAI